MKLRCIETCGNVAVRMRFGLILSAAALLNAQSAPRTKATDYPVHVQMETVTLAAEYLVHSLPTPTGPLLASDYLVVEVAFFGPAFSRLKMSPDQFTLRVNGHGAPLSTQLPGMVAGSIKFPKSTAHPSLTGTAGVGDGNGQVVVGPRPPPSQFPGDGRDRTASTQPITQVQKEQEDTVDYRVQNASLPEGEHSLPRSGLIYFLFRGRTKGIHSLELFYNGPMGKTALKLLP
ncbi:MAG TPA: hypothetical protein VMT15_04330 [Bryobacteraceae bacterium]|nr:hypothetical protein [Bryobacteraceae bacterium]